MFVRSVTTAALIGGLLSSTAMAQGFLTSANGLVSIGVNAEGHLDTDATAIGGPSTANAGPLGIAYNFSGQGGRSGWQDALSPGCLCEAWGVAGDGAGAQVGVANGNSGISLISQNFVAGTSFTSVTERTASPGLTVTHTFTVATETATGALFQAAVTITNTTAAVITDVRYARAMDWDVPPTEFSEFVTHGGTGTTPTLLRSTNDGFAFADPMTAVTNGGIGAVPDTDGDQGGINDHGSLFVFGFGDFDPGESYTFNIYYGAGANLRDAGALLTAIGPELFSIGQSSVGGIRQDGLPTYVFAFNGLGGIIIDPPGVPAPAALGLFGLGLLGFAAARRLRRA